MPSFGYGHSSINLCPPSDKGYVSGTYAGTVFATSSTAFIIEVVVSNQVGHRLLLLRVLFHSFSSLSLSLLQTFPLPPSPRFISCDTVPQSEWDFALATGNPAYCIEDGVPSTFTINMTSE